MEAEGRRGQWGLWRRARVEGAGTVEGLRRLASSRAARSRLGELLLALALAGGVLRLLAALPPLYPPRAPLLIAPLLVGATLVARGWGLVTALALLLLPLWTLSPLLAVVTAGGAVALRGIVVARLPWALLVAAAPLAAEWYLLALIPLLAGLSGGARRGGAVGLLAAFWVELAAMLGGQSPLFATLQGVPIAGAGLAATGTIALLRELVGAVRDAGPLLLLQPLGWGLAGWLTGLVAAIEWPGERPRFPHAPALAAGALALWATLYLLPVLLRLEPAMTFLYEPTRAAAVALSALGAGLLAALHTMIWPARGRAPRLATRLGREGYVPVVEEIHLPRRPRVTDTHEDDARGSGSD